MNDIAMDRAAIAAEKHLRFGVFLIHLLQARQHFIPAYLLFVEEVVPVFINGDADVIALRLRLTRDARGQIDLDAFHMHLAQAHHHEAGEEKEHDVDQRNDLDPRFLVRYGRSDSHGFA